MKQIQFFIHFFKIPTFNQPFSVALSKDSGYYPSSTNNYIIQNLNTINQ